MRTTYYINKEVHRTIREIAEQEGLTKSKVVNWLIVLAVDKYNRVIETQIKSGKHFIKEPKVKGF